jgi:hypothetical protein
LENKFPRKSQDSLNQTFCGVTQSLTSIPVLLFTKQLQRPLRRIIDGKRGP